MGNNIKAERVRRGLTQTELGEVLGVTQLTVSRWEQGDCEPGGRNLVSMSGFFGCSPEYLLDLVNDPNAKLKGAIA